MWTLHMGSGSGGGERVMIQITLSGSFPGTALGRDAHLCPFRWSIRGESDWMRWRRCVTLPPGPRPLSRLS